MREHGAARFGLNPASWEIMNVAILKEKTALGPFAGQVVWDNLGPQMRFLRTLQCSRCVEERGQFEGRECRRAPEGRGPLLSRHQQLHQVRLFLARLGAPRGIGVRALAVAEQSLPVAEDALVKGFMQFVCGTGHEKRSLTAPKRSLPNLRFAGIGKQTSGCAAEDSVRTKVVKADKSQDGLWARRGPKGHFLLCLLSCPQIFVQHRNCLCEGFYHDAYRQGNLSNIVSLTVGYPGPTAQKFKRLHNTTGYHSSKRTSLVSATGTLST